MYSDYFDTDVNSLLMDFFWEITTTEEYDYIVLMSRKMYSFFRSYSFQNEIRSTVISSDAVPFIKDQFAGKNVLIVDDIFIHGRTMAKIGKLLSKRNFGTAHVDYKVFVVDESSIPMMVKSHGLRKLTYFLSLPRNMWRRVSRQVVERIRGTLTPLRFSVCYADLYTSLSQSEFVDKLGLVCLPSLDPEYNTVTSYIWHPKWYKVSDFSKGLLYDFSVRLDFSSQEDSHVLAVPQVLLNPLHEKDIRLLFARFSSREVPPEDMCKFIEYSVSQWGIQMCKTELKEDLGLTDDCIVLNYSDLGYCFSEDLIAFARSNDFMNEFTSIVNEQVDQYALSLSPGNAMEEIGLTAIEQRETMAFLEYLSFCGYADDTLHEFNAPDRIEGARLQFLLQSMGINPIDIFYALSVSITTYQLVLKNQWVTMRIVPGESAFAYMLYKDRDLIVRIQDELIRANHSGAKSDKAFDRCAALLKSNNEDVDHDISVIMQCLRKYHNKLINACDSTLCRNKYIQYLTDMDIRRLYPSNS